MNKGFKILVIVLVIIVLLIVAASATVLRSLKEISAGEVETPTISIGDSPVLNSYTKYVSVADIKDEFKGSSNESAYAFKPFYNVEQTTEFTFRFKSNVDPIKAVTVHTDSKCEEDSIVYQLNDGYKTADGVDVVVKPRNPILGSKQRSDYQTGYMWGFAPVYYLCVRYDLDSTTVQELKDPIVIPFTIRNEITTPTAYANISNDGVFSVDWLPVEGAKEYRIYSVSMPNAKVRNKTREEVAYCADEGKMKLVKTVPSNVLSYVNDTMYPDNIYTSKSSFGDKNDTVAMQNFNTGYTYYVTAVDSKGNESFFSKAICDWQYLDIIPYKIKDTFIGSITEFPNVIKVTMADNQVVTEYPINFYKVEEPKDYLNTVYYRYEVQNTKLQGYVQLKNEEKVFPSEHISTLVINGGSFYKDHLPEIAPVSVPQIIDSEYKNASINLKDKVSYPENAKIKLDASALLRRADIEAARYIGDGVYPETSHLDSIKSYVASDNPEYIVVRHDGIIEMVKASDYKENPVEPSKPSEPEKPTEPTKPQEPERPSEPTQVEPVKPSEPTQVEPQKPIEPEKPSAPEAVEVEQPKEEINNVNYVEIQKESTKKDVEEGNKEQVATTDYPVYAETAGQKYLALALINHEEDVSLKAFPQYQDMMELIDDLQYVWYQNPYIMTVIINDCTYTYDTQTLHVKYGVDANTTKRYQEAVAKKAKEVADQVTKSSMSDFEKVIAIYDYLEKNGSYNHTAFDYAMKGNNDFYTKYANSWNTYGILCENLGVCQSYAYAFNAIAHEAGLDSIMVTGTINNGGHAWNATKLNGKYYMVDPTNNNKDGKSVPYVFVNIGRDLATKYALIPDDGFVDGDLTELNNPITKDSDQDWYVKNGLYAKDTKEIAKILKNKLTESDILFIKYDASTINFGLDTTYQSIVDEYRILGGDVNKIATLLDGDACYGIHLFATPQAATKLQ